MGFIDRYVRALGASNLQDDARHRQAEPLLAAAFASAGITGDLGPLLHRVKYADGPMRNPGNLTQLLRVWTAEVIKRGRARKWVPENTAWDAQAARKLYHTVAELSLAHWLDGMCKPCAGTGKTGRHVCRDCAGGGEAPIQHAGGFVRERVKDMVSELHCIASSHAARANARLNGRDRE
jgi:hypothetical protein